MTFWSELGVVCAIAVIGVLASLLLALMVSVDPTTVMPQM
jgi:hypothetical protein